MPDLCSRSQAAAGNKRKLRVLAQPNVTLSMQHVPRHCRRARVALLGPLMPEDLDAASFVQYQPGAWQTLDPIAHQLTKQPVGHSFLCQVAACWRLCVLCPFGSTWCVTQSDTRHISRSSSQLPVPEPGNPVGVQVKQVLQLLAVLGALTLHSCCGQSAASALGGPMHCSSSRSMGSCF